MWGTLNWLWTGKVHFIHRLQRRDSPDVKLINLSVSRKTHERNPMEVRRGRNIMHCVVYRNRDTATLVKIHCWLHWMLLCLHFHQNDDIVYSRVHAHQLKYVALNNSGDFIIIRYTEENVNVFQDNVLTLYRLKAVDSFFVIGMIGFHSTGTSNIVMA